MNDKVSGLAHEEFLDLLATVVDAAPSPMVITTAGDEMSHYVAANVGFLDLVGRAWDDLVGKPVRVCGVAIVDEARARRMDLLSQGREYESEPVRLMRGDGSVVVVVISAKRIYLNGFAFDAETIVEI